MGRRADHTREQLAALVIEAAGKIIAADGPEALSMRAIAASIGYAAGSIYNAVGDVRRVISEVNTRTLDALADCIEREQERRPANASPIDRALRIADAYLEFVQTHPALWAAVLANPEAPASTLHAAARMRNIAIVERVLEPFFPSENERHTAVIALWSAMQGIATLALGGNYSFMGVERQSRDIAHLLIRRFLER
jgi:AcrR family transcriptional regulator